MPLKRNVTKTEKKNRSPSWSALKSWCQKRKKNIGIVLGVIVLMFAALVGYMYYQGTQVSSQAAKSQESIKTNPFKIAEARNGEYSYGAENDGIPNAKQLSEYQALTTPMTTWGYAAAPVQPGLDNPINVLPVNEGVSNQVLAWGWGTVKSGYTMGHLNNVLAAHNFADAVTYASPLQYIDVSKKPKFYQTDGKKLYTYQLTKKDTVPAVSREYTNTVQQTVTDKVTLVTCDEPNFVVNLNPEKRIVVSGERISTTDFKKASSETKNLFPKFN